MEKKNNERGLEHLCYEDKQKALVLFVLEKICGGLLVPK